MKYIVLIIALILSVALVFLAVRYAPDTSGTIAGQAYGSVLGAQPVIITQVQDEGDAIRSSNRNP